MDFNKMLEKLTTSDKVIGASAILLLIFSFFPWYGKSGYSRNGWSYLLFGIIPILLAIIMAAQIGVSRFTETKLPTLPISWAQIHLIAGSLATLLILLKLIIGDKYSFGLGILGKDASVSLDRSFGIFLAFLAAAGLAAGGFMKLQEPAEAGEATPPPAT